MFIGHFAVALAAKRIAPRTSLATLVAAATFVDVLWPIFLLLGIESVRIAPGLTEFTPLDFVSYPWTHSLLMGLVWGALFGLVYRAPTKYARGAWVLAALVVSHWVLDWIVHVPDLPLTPWGASREGLGLWRSVPATIAVEGALFIAALALYLATTRARNRRGALGFWGFVAFLLVAYVSNIIGQPPPGVTAIAVVALIGTAISLAWIGWFDRNRELRAAPLSEAGTSPSGAR
jgi:hypothetical protein